MKPTGVAPAGDEPADTLQRVVRRNPCCRWPGPDRCRPPFSTPTRPAPPDTLRAALSPCCAPCRRPCRPMVRRHEKSFGYEWGRPGEATMGDWGQGRANAPNTSANQKRNATFDRGCCGLCLSPALTLHKLPLDNRSRQPPGSQTGPFHPAIRRRRLTAPHAGEGARTGTVTAHWADKSLARSQKTGVLIAIWNAAVHRWFPGLPVSLSSCIQMAPL
jgi:hypothetical protein